MKTVIVNYSLPSKPQRAVIIEEFTAAANNIFKNMPGLFSKQFCYDENTGNGQSVYLWETGERAKQFFSAGFTEHFRSVFGVEPTVTFLDTLVVVDNRASDILIN